MKRKKQAKRALLSPFWNLFWTSNCGLSTQKHRSIRTLKSTISKGWSAFIQYPSSHLPSKREGG